MTFRIADTFTSALANLTNQEQKAVKTTVFDLQVDPTGNGLQLHKLTGGRDKRFWSARVSKDLRIILHRWETSVLLCYVDHHDDAYAWANDRKVEVHPKTGAAQLVEVEQVSREVVIPTYVAQPDAVSTAPAHTGSARATAQKKKPPLADYDRSWLLQYGIPEEWIDKLRAATEDELLTLTEHLPGEAAEAVVDIAIGSIPPVPLQRAAAPEDPFEHPDALRRFRVIDSREELAAALELPWDKWRTFLHPSQRELIDKSFSGPARVTGSAGTGKTVVALHRAAHLVRSDKNAVVLLTTINGALARVLQNALNNLLRHEPRLAERIVVEGLDDLARKLFRARQKDLRIAKDVTVNEELFQSAETVDHNFTPAFLLKEFHGVVDPWQVTTWEEYETIPRIGRRTRLAAAKRAQAWAVFDDLRSRLAEQGLTTLFGAYAWLSDHFSSGDYPSPFTHVVVDEAQDVGVAQLRFLRQLVGVEPNRLFFTGDTGQRIFQTPFSWFGLGIELRGRSTKLRINYRTSHQIRRQADRLLAPVIEDVDGHSEERGDTLSVFNGPDPIIKGFSATDAEWHFVGQWITHLVTEQDIAPERIAVFVRSSTELDRAHNAIHAAGQQVCELDEQLKARTGCIVLSTMHLAKGQEFRAVAVMAVDEDVIPSQDRLESIRDAAEIEEVYDTERHLLYVACTRARDRLLITYTGDSSEFLSDITAGG